MSKSFCDALCSIKATNVRIVTKQDRVFYAKRIDDLTKTAMNPTKLDLEKIDSLWLRFDENSSENYKNYIRNEALWSPLKIRSNEHGDSFAYLAISEKSVYDEMKNQGEIEEVSHKNFSIISKVVQLTQKGRMLIF